MLVVVAIALGACGPSLPDDPAHPASARAAAAPSPELARALTEDPAPPPEELSAAQRSYAADGDEGVHPPILGIAEHVPGTPRPSREPRVVDHGDHRDHGDHPDHGDHRDHGAAPPDEAR